MRLNPPCSGVMGPFCVKVTLRANIATRMCSSSLQPDWLISQMGDRCIVPRFLLGIL